MPELNCLIIEDEPLAARVIEDYIAQVPGLNLSGSCGDVFSAGEKLRAGKTDVIFLDINLPKINGLDFIRSLNHKNYHIILTTAYHEYALEGFNLNVVDYLLKPIAFSRFLQAVNKVHALCSAAPSASPVVPSEQNYYFFTVDKKRVKIYYDEILYIESLKDYVKVHTASRTIVTKFQIGEIEGLLPGRNFFRIHKSFIANLNYLRAYTASDMEISGINLPIGRTYLELLKKHIGSNVGG